MKICDENDPARGEQPQVRKFHLPYEPFRFDKAIAR